MVSSRMDLVLFLQLALVHFAVFRAIYMPSSGLVLLSWNLLHTYEVVDFSFFYVEVCNI